MKANDVLKKYNITRQTLCAWVKQGKLEVVKLPNGRYDYFDSDEEVIPQSTIVENKSADKSPNDLLLNCITILRQVAEVEKEFMYWLHDINFDGPERAQQIEKLLNEFDFVSAQIVSQT